MDDNCMIKILKQAIAGRADGRIVYVQCKALKQVGVSGKILEGIHEERPVPVLVGDLKEIIENAEAKED